MQDMVMIVLIVPPDAPPGNAVFLQNFPPSHLHTPESASTANPETAISRGPTEIRDLIIALPDSTRPSLHVRGTALLGRCAAGMAHEIPHQDERIIGPTGQQTAMGGAPFDAVDCCTVAFEFEQGLSGLSYVQDSDGL
jgi:hypothetical protein